nr:unnamed protein product [Callosobruchus chinensis]
MEFREGQFDSSVTRP